MVRSAASQPRPELVALEAFARRQSPAGKLQTYCRRRVENAWMRFAVILLCGGLILAFDGPAVAAVTVMVVAGGEALDCLFLRRLSRREGDPGRIYLRMASTSALAAVQAVAACYGLTVLLQSIGSAGHFFVSAICLGLLLDAASYGSINRGAAIARIYVLFPFLLGSHYAQWLTSDAPTFELILDMMSVAVLVYFGWVFLHQGAVNYRRRNAAQFAQLKQSEQLAVLNDALAETEHQNRQMAMAVEQASDSVALTDPKGRNFWINHAFETMMG